MNQCVTPAPSCDLSDVDAKQLQVVSDDFLTLLDEKLRRRNECLITKLLAWGELLDRAGWSVALGGAGGFFWLSTQAKRDLIQVGDMPETWTDLLGVLDGMSPETFHQKGAGVVVWSRHAAPVVVAGLYEGLTRREIEVMFWLREGKTGSEIAIILGCATRTAEKHLANLYRKLGVKNRAAVILKTSIPAT